MFQKPVPFAALSVALALVVAACSPDPTTPEEYQDLELRLAAARQQLDDPADPTTSEEYQDLEAQLGAAQRQLEDTAAELAALASATDNTAAEDGKSAPGTAIGDPLDLDTYTAAWGSGDPDQIRAFYTADAAILPFGHIIGQIDENTPLDFWLVAGPDIDREAREHIPGTLEIREARRVGDIAAFTYRWTFPSFWITGGVIQHYRGDLIWRESIDAQIVYR